MTPQAPLIDRKRAAEACRNAADLLLSFTIAGPGQRIVRELRQLALALDAPPEAPLTAQGHELAAVRALHEVMGGPERKSVAVVRPIVEAAALRAVELATQAIDGARAELERVKPMRVAEAPGRRRKGGRR